MNRVPLDETYFTWLYSQVGSVKNLNRTKTYWKLLRIFYAKEFTWSKKMEKDANRAQDGKDLRQDFLRDTNTPLDEPGWMDMPCSFLELLISLAWKLEFQGGGKQSDWFWEMVNNLHLMECTDATTLNEEEIEHVLDFVMERGYDSAGVGGLFPLAHPDKDQRYVELWYQAEAYLLERL